MRAFFMEYLFSKYEVKAAFLFTVGLMTLLFCLETVRFDVNDDIAITSLVKGLFGLAPNGEGVFISPFLGGLLFLLYKHLPVVSWFSFFLYTGVSLACFLGSLTVLMTIRTPIGKITGVLGLAFFIWFTAIQINFTAVSLMLWVTGGVFLLYSVRSNIDIPPNLWFCLSSLQMAAAYLLRPSLLPLLTLVAAPLFLTLLFRGNRRLACWALTPLIVAITLSFLSGMVVRGGDAYSEYSEFNKIRSEFNDTDRAAPNPQTRHALFAAGWSVEDYQVLRNWWLHDSTFFNTKQINIFLEGNGKKTAIFNSADVKKNFSENFIYLLVILLWILCVLLPNKRFEIDKIRPSDILGYLFLVSVVLILMGIRFPQRVAYPCFLMLFINSFIIFENLSDNTSKSVARMLPPLFFIFFLIYVFLPIATQKLKDVELIKEHIDYVNQSLVRVLQENGSDSLIVDVNPNTLPTNYLPFQENDPLLKTHIMPGGWLVGTPAYSYFLKQEGLGDRSTAVAKMIDNRRVVLRFWDSPQLPYDKYLKNIFLRHLQQRYSSPGSGCRIDLKILKDFRQGNNGLIYFQLVTSPSKTVSRLL